MGKQYYQQGFGHLILFIVIFVAIAGLLGFVGYSAWQKQQANAGDENVLARPPAPESPAPYITCQVSLTKVGSDRHYDYYKGKAVFKNIGRAAAKKSSKGDLYVYWQYDSQYNRPYTNDTGHKKKSILINPVPRLDPGKRIVRYISKFRHSREDGDRPGSGGWIVFYGNYPNSKKWCS